MTMKVTDTYARGLVRESEEGWNPEDIRSLVFSLLNERNELEHRIREIKDSLDAISGARY